MAFITYKQADSRWGKKNYNGSSTMATAGCGPTSCAMIAYGVDGKTTPLDTMKYMQSHGYAIRNNGTAWNGIPACLKAFGVKDVQEVPNMTKCWELMKKGYVGVFLFRKGSKGGVTWTTSGHYVAVTDYKYQNGKHYVYTRDSGGRNHTGWYAYETTMKGLIPKIWLGKVEEPKPISKPSGKYTGSIPKPTLKRGSKGDSVKNLQKFLNWYGNFKLSVDGEFGGGTLNALKTFQRTEGISADGVYGNQSYTKAKAYYVAPTKPTTPTTPSTPTVKKPTGKYSGTIPSPTLKKGSKGTSVKNLQKFLNWYGGFKLSVDGGFGDKTLSALKTFQKTEGLTADGIYGSKSQAKAKTYKATTTKTTTTTSTATGANAKKLIAQMDKIAWKYGTAKSKYAYKTGAPTSACKTAMKKYKYNTKAKYSDCGNFVNTVVREAGIDKSFTSLHGVKKAFPKSESKFNIVHSGKAIPSGLLKAGDIIRYKKTGSDQHAMFYYGNGKVCDAGHYNRFGNIRADEKRYGFSNVKKSTIQVLRVKE